MAGRCVIGKVVKTVLSVAAIVTGVGLLIPAAISAFGVGAGLALAFVQRLAITVGLTSLFAPELPGIDAAKQLAANLNIFSDPLAIRSVPQGHVGIAGQILFRDNIENAGTEDDPDEVLVILGLAGYPATSLENFWFNGEVINIGGEQTADTDALSGAITTGKFANDLWVWFRTGQNDTAAFPAIATLSTAWAAKTRKLRGIPSIGLRVKVRKKLDGKLQPLAQIKGAKFYDPRLDSTVPGGSGTHRIDDQTTWTFPSNSTKLAELAYLIGGKVNGVRIFGMGKPAAAIDLENFASEQNICEEQIAVNAGGTIDRYTLNGLLIPDRDHRSNLQALLSASAGTMDASGGVYRTFAGAWRASSMTLTESDIDGAPTDIQLQKDQSEEVNIISGSFADPNDQWQVKEYPQLRDETSIAQIGEESTTLDLPFTNDHRIAQRISKIVMKRLNAARSFGANYWLRAASLQPGDIVTQTYARYTINSETFRVQLWGLEASPDRDGAERLVVPMGLVEEQQSWFDWTAATEEKALTGVTLLPPMNRLPRYEPGADVTALRVLGNILINGSLETGTLEGWSADIGIWEVDTIAPRSGTFHAGGGAATQGGNLQLANKSRLQVEAGDRVLAQGFCSRTGTIGAEPRRLRVFIRWRDASDLEISLSVGNDVTTAAYALSRIIGVAPAGAVTAEFVFNSPPHSGDVQGFRADGAYMAIIPRGLDITDAIAQATSGTVTSVPAMSNNALLNTDIITVAFTPSQDGELKLTASCDVRVADDFNSGTGFANFLLGLSSGTGLDSRIPTYATPDSGVFGTLPGAYVPFTLTVKTDVTKGTNYTARLQYSQKASPADPANVAAGADFTNKIIRVEVNLE